MRIEFEIFRVQMFHSEMHNMSAQFCFVDAMLFFRKLK